MSASGAGKRSRARRGMFASSRGAYRQAQPASSAVRRLNHVELWHRVPRGVASGSSSCGIGFLETVSEYGRGPGATSGATAAGGR